MVMQWIRDNRFKKLVLWIVLIGIIPSFIIFFGVGRHGGSSGGHSQLAFVTVKLPDGEKKEIRREEMAEAKRDLAMFYAQSIAMGRGVPPSFFAERIGQALQNEDVARHAVGLVALKEHVREQEIAVSNKQVENQLRRDGVSAAEFEQAAQARGLSNNELIVERRNEIAGLRGQRAVQRVARASLLELWDQHRMIDEKLSVATLAIPAAQFYDKVEVTDADLQAEFERRRVEEPESIRIPSRRKFQYVRMDPPAPLPMQLATDLELRPLYDKLDPAKPENTIGSGARVRHVLVSINTQTTDTAALASARAAAEAARARIESGEDMGNVANEVTTDLRNLSFFSADTTPTLSAGVLPRALGDNEEPIWGAAYAEFIRTAPIGTLSPVLETPQGFAVARVEERGTNLRRPFESVRESLNEEWNKAQQDTITKDRREKIAANVDKARSAVGTESSIEGVGRALGLQVASTDFVNEGQTFIIGIGNLSEERAALEDLEKGDISSPLVTTNGEVVVLHVLDKELERLQTVEEAKALLTNEVKRRKGLELARARAEEIRGQIKPDDRLTTWSLANNLTAVETKQEFSRAEPPQELANLRGFSNLSLRARKGDTIIVPTGAGALEDGVALVQITAVKEPDRAAFVSNLQTLELVVLAAKRQGALADFYQDAEETLQAAYSEELVPSRAPRSSGTGG